MRTAVVTGANGFIGSALVRELLQNDYQVCAVCRENSRENIPVHPNVEIVSWDLSNAESLNHKLPQAQYDFFFHMAWAGSAGADRSDTALQLKNAQWTIDALRTAGKLNGSRFIVAGSIMEREAVAAAHLQGNRPGMGYIYGGGKLAAHIMSASVAAEMGVDILWGMITNTYGPGERNLRLVNSTIQKCIKGEHPEFTSGTQNYDFVYIDDAARAFRLIAEKGMPFHEYLIGSSQPKPLREFLLEMQAAIAPALEFRFGDIPFTGVNLPLSAFDASKTREDTGFQAEISFAEGCRRTMEWMKAQNALRGI